MAEMSMNRAIHGAFRRDLTRFINALDNFPTGDRVRAAQLGTAWANFNAQLTRHHTGEHEIAWPALREIGVDMELLEQMDAEHEQLAAALDSANTAMTALQRTATPADAGSARDAMIQLQTVATQHMDHEEAEIEAVYMSNRDDPVMKAMGRKFGKVSPPVGGTFFAWVTDGATPDEWAAIKEFVPGPVFGIINGIWGRKYRREVAPVWQH